MIPCMRTVVLILLMALLPLRSWAVGLMALAAAAQPISVLALSQRPTPAQLHAHCAEPGTDTAAAANPAASDADDRVSDTPCTSCLLCHAAAHVALTLMPALFDFPRAVPAAGTERFANAELACGFKPPIF